MTVLFADVVHSMDIAREVGTERLREIMADLVDCASAVVQGYGGTVDKFTGDGIMAVFGAPLALEDHAVRACLSALGLQERVAGVQLRIGLNSGQVITGEIGSGALGYTAVGEHVGMAQRMEAAAPPGGVMLSASTARLVDGVASLGPPELVQIKGAAEPVPARRLLGISQNPAKARAESNLVGRRWEISAIEGVLDRAIDGQGTVVGVSGPAGIGKSRLVRELAAMAGSRGVQVFTTFCESHTSQVPFHVVKKLFRSATGIEGLDPAGARAFLAAQPRDVDPEDAALFDDLLGIADPDVPLPQIDPDARRRRLTALVNSATLRNSTPMVYVIEDAHWIDEASESMFADFLAVIPQTPLLTVITYRPDYRGILASVPGAQTIALAPLSDRETRQLVTDLLGTDPSVQNLGEAIVERAAGTPFFAEEIVLDLAERGVLDGDPGAYVSTRQAAAVVVPATLQATIASRIDRLDPKAKRALGAAAVIGLRFSRDLLASLNVEPMVDELLAAQLIDQVSFSQHPEYVFHQPLIRTVAYETQLRSDRADIHRRVAAAIEQRSGTSADENAALVAEHLEAAGDLHEAYQWHMRAGAWSTNRDIAAARLSWERASEVANALSADLPLRIAPQTMLCATDWRIHSDDPGVRFDGLRKLCARAGDKTSLVLSMQGPMAGHIQRGESEQAQRMATEQLALLDSIGDPALTAQAAFSSIAIKAQTGEMTEVLRWAQATIEWADGDVTKGNLIVASPLSVAMAMRGIARAWFGQPDWRRDLDVAVSYAEQSGEPMTLAMAMSWKFGTGTWTGALAADEMAVKKVGQALRAVETAGDDYALTMVNWLLTTILLLGAPSDQRQRALVTLQALRKTFLQQRILLNELPIVDVYLARESARSGDVAVAIAGVRRAVDVMYARNLIGYNIPAISVLVETLLDRGTQADLIESATVIARLAALPLDGSVVRDIWVLRMQTLLARARGDESGYRELSDRYREMATSLGFEGHMQWAAAML